MADKKPRCGSHDLRAERDETTPNVTQREATYASGRRRAMMSRTSIINPHPGKAARGGGTKLEAPLQETRGG
jgi:hypothetical protein